MTWIKPRDDNGYTMIELTITVALIAILTVVVSAFAVTGMEQYTVSRVRADMLNESHLALSIAQNDIRLAASADEQNRWPDTHAPASPTDDFSWQSNADTLILATAVLDDANEIIFADPALYISEKNNIIYFVDNGALYKRVLASPVANNAARTTCPQSAATSDCPADVKLIENVTDFTVRYLNENDTEVVPPDARSVELAITLSKPAYGRDIEVDYKTRMVFRND